MHIVAFIVRDNKVVDKKYVKEKASKALNAGVGIATSALALTGIEAGSRALTENVLGRTIPVAGSKFGGSGMYDIFSRATLPYFYDIGNAMVLISFSFAAYQVIRKEHKQGFERIKWTAFGNIVLHMVTPFLLFINKIATDMEKQLTDGMNNTPQ